MAQMCNSNRIVWIFFAPIWNISFSLFFDSFEFKIQSSDKTWYTKQKKRFKKKILFFSFKYTYADKRRRRSRRRRRHHIEAQKCWFDYTYVL